MYDSIRTEGLIHEAIDAFSSAQRIDPADPKHYANLMKAYAMRTGGEIRGGYIRTEISSLHLKNKQLLQPANLPTWFFTSFLVVAQGSSRISSHKTGKCNRDRFGKMSRLILDVKDVILGRHSELSGLKIMMLL